MQGSEYQVAGFCRRQRQADGLQVAHFADQNNVRIFTQSRAQRFIESVCITVDFALIDQTLFTFVHKLDGILDSEDVFESVIIDMIHHGSQRGRLAGTGRPGDQYDTARLIGDFPENCRTAQLFQR